MKPFKEIQLPIGLGYVVSLKDNINKTILESAYNCFLSYVQAKRLGIPKFTFNILYYRNGYLIDQLIDINTQAYTDIIKLSSHDSFYINQKLIDLVYQVSKILPTTKVAIDSTFALKNQMAILVFFYIILKPVLDKTQQINIEAFVNKYCLTIDNILDK